MQGVGGLVKQNVQKNGGSKCSVFTSWLKGALDLFHNDQHEVTF